MQPTVQSTQTYLVLASHIPNSEADIFVLHGLHIETCRGQQLGEHKCTGTAEVGQQLPLPLTDGGDGRDNLSKLELVQDGCFTSSIKPHLQQELCSGHVHGLSTAT